jgi:hypothetical protein
MPLQIRAIPTAPSLCRTCLRVNHKLKPFCPTCGHNNRHDACPGCGRRTIGTIYCPDCLQYLQGQIQCIADEKEYRKKHFPEKSKAEEDAEWEKLLNDL